MNNQEILQMAAKAYLDAIRWDVSKHVPLDEDGIPFGWDPLYNNKDALGLAAELRLLVKPGKHKGDGCTVESQRDGIAGCTAFYDDSARQMRYAITRVAAEIGSKMA